MAVVEGVSLRLNGDEVEHSPADMTIGAIAQVGPLCITRLPVHLKKRWAEDARPPARLGCFRSMMSTAMANRTRIQKEVRRTVHRPRINGAGVRETSRAAGRG